MAKYRHHLPQLADRLFMTDGGLDDADWRLLWHGSSSRGRHLPPIDLRRIAGDWRPGDA